VTVNRVVCRDSDVNQ